MHNRHTQTLAAGLLIGALLVLLYFFEFFFSWSAKMDDALFADRKPGNDIVIVAIDNDSIVKIGRWPWDRKVHAELLDKLGVMEPAVIGLDVNFSEQSNDDSDKELAAAIGRAGNVVLPIEADIRSGRNSVLASDLLFPFQQFQEAAYGTGIANTPSDRDDIFRRLPVVIEDNEGRAYESFAETIARRFLSSRSADLQEIPADKGLMAVNFVGRPGTFPVIPAIDILEGRINADRIKHKAVLIGATAPDLHDRIAVPNSRGNLMNGVEVHANAIHTIISGKFLKNFNTAAFALILLITPVLVCLIVSRLNFRRGALTVLAVAASYVLTAAILFERGLVLNIFYFLAGIALAYLAAIAIKYLAEEKEKRFIRNTFGQYVSPEIVDELMADPKKLKLGGYKKELTVMFSDIRGFTSLSEKLSPEELVSLLNEYLSVMTEVVLDRGGVVDKFIGDAIMAFWGAPLDRRDHARLACETALDMIALLNENRPGWEKKYGVEMNIGIGINTGDLIIGNLGSDKRFDYTVIGDSVNLASRLEGLTKQYGVRIIASEFTKAQAGDDFLFRRADKVAVKGKSRPVDIYELMGRKAEASAETAALAEMFDKGVELYQAKDWEKAEGVFSDLSRRFPDDLASRLYLDRCREYSADPPAEWDGVYRPVTK